MSFTDEPEDVRYQKWMTEQVCAVSEVFPPRRNTVFWGEPKTSPNWATAASIRKQYVAIWKATRDSAKFQKFIPKRIIQNIEARMNEMENYSYEGLRSAWSHRALSQIQEDMEPPQVVENAIIFFIHAVPLGCYMPLLVNGMPDGKYVLQVLRDLVAVPNHLGAILSYKPGHDELAEPSVGLPPALGAKLRSANNKLPTTIIDLTETLAPASKSRRSKPSRGASNAPRSASSASRADSNSSRPASFSAAVAPTAPFPANPGPTPAAYAQSALLRPLVNEVEGPFDGILNHNYFASIPDIEPRPMPQPSQSRNQITFFAEYIQYEMTQAMRNMHNAQKKMENGIRENLIHVLVADSKRRDEVLFEKLRERDQEIAELRAAIGKLTLGTDNAADASTTDNSTNASASKALTPDGSATDATTNMEVEFEWLR